jgi:hypothetical protein
MTSMMIYPVVLAVPYLVSCDIDQIGTPLPDLSIRISIEHIPWRQFLLHMPTVPNLLLLQIPFHLMLVMIVVTMCGRVIEFVWGLDHPTVDPSQMFFVVPPRFHTVSSSGCVGVVFGVFLSVSCGLFDLLLLRCCMHHHYLSEAGWSMMMLLLSVSRCDDVCFFSSTPMHML